MNVGMKLQTSELKMARICCCFSMTMSMSIASFPMHMKT